MYEKKDREKAFERRWGDPTIARGMMLAHFLNRSSPASRRILDILELFRKAVEAAHSAPNGLPRYERIEESSEITIQSTHNWSGFQSMNSANELLKKYKVSLRLETQTNGVSLLRSTPQHETSESEAAHAVVMLAEAGWGNLSLLRRCRGCEEWFFAERKDKVSCNNDCRSTNRERNHFYKTRDRLKQKIRYWANKPTASPKAKAAATERKKAAEQELKALLEEKVNAKG